MNLSYQQAYEINQWIDKIHNPSWWILGGVVGVLGILESYLQKRDYFESILEKILVYIKFFFINSLGVVFFTQGLFNGCLIQIPQNIIARVYLNRPYWYPFGIVYRESLSPQFWPILRLFYLLIGIFALVRAVVYYRKFIKNRQLVSSAKKVSFSVQSSSNFSINKG